MPPAGRRRSYCKQCGGRGDRVGPISHRGLCAMCAATNLVEHDLGASTLWSSQWTRTRHAALEREARRRQARESA